ncbi:nuclear transport factor 2 family protein [Isoptericola hypogeus]
MDTAVTRQVTRTFYEAIERRDWSAVVALLDPGVVYEMPQSRERISGRDRYLQFNQEYPGDWHLRIRRVVADGPYAAAWVDGSVGDEHQDASAWLEVSPDGLIVRVTEYWPEPYEPPAGREHLTERYGPE